MILAFVYLIRNACHFRMQNFGVLSIYRTKAGLRGRRRHALQRHALTTARARNGVQRAAADGIEWVLVAEDAGSRFQSAIGRQFSRLPDVAYRCTIGKFRRALNAQLAREWHAASSDLTILRNSDGLPALPTALPVLTNLLTVILAGIALYRVWSKSELSTENATIPRLTLLGHAAVVNLFLGYWWFYFRYRFDFVLFMTLPALIGYASVSMAETAALESWRKEVRIAAIGLCFPSILSSNYELLLEKVYGWEVPMHARLASPSLPFAPFAAHYVVNR